MLSVKNLMVFFENALALNDFSMEVREGSIVGVIGSNSAGKTTLMNTLSGLIIDNINRFIEIAGLLCQLLGCFTGPVIRFI